LVNTRYGLITTPIPSRPPLLRNTGQQKECYTLRRRGGQIADPNQSRIICFGLFEVDPRAGELRKNGVKIKLQEQPFQILLTLLSRPGDIVTREELCKQLWAEDTFVDFDHSLNAAIKRLRDALGESAEAPVFIETLARRGYRFMAPVDMRIIARVEQRPHASSPARAVPRINRSSVLALAAIIATTLSLVVALNWTRIHDGASRNRIESLAVLPLENLSHDPEEEYFADGMTEELITNLSKIGALRVISRTSVMQYKGARKSLPEIARELKVDGIIEGSVLRSGSRVRITAQLINAQADQHLWGATYDRDLRDILVLQSEVARTVAQEVRVTLTPQEHKYLSNAQTVDPEAYQLYLQGRHYVSIEQWEKGREYFDQATQRDPTFALAYAGLADCYRYLDMSGSLSPREAYPKAKAAVLKALELNDNLAEAHAALGQIRFMFEWDWSSPEGDFKRALELNPSSADVYSLYGNYLIQTGQFDEGIAALKRAIELDPLTDPVSVDLGWAYFNSKRYDEGIAQLRTLSSLNVDLVRVPLAFNYAGKGLYNQALAECDKVQGPSLCGWVYAVSGKRAEALSSARRLAEIFTRKSINMIWIAGMYTALGDKEEAFRILEKNYSEHTVGITFLKVAPEFDPLRSDPRFQDLLRRIGLPP
jgi:TolB-like protein/DNA-binding winged helix-turn-helix (wHTH) protein